VTDGGADSGSWKSPGITCGKDEDGTIDYCAPSSNICCARSAIGGGGGGNKSYECVASNPFNACQGGTAIACDDASDCPNNQICCGIFDQNWGYRSVQCQATCNSSPIPNTAPVRFCDPNAPTDQCAGTGKNCLASDSLKGGGFFVCK